jgi:hypothetical protein
MTTTVSVRAGLQLTNRDIKMLAALEVWGVLGIGQMLGLGMAETLDEAGQVERFFNAMDRNDYMLSVAKRVHMLEVSGYIQGHSYMRQPKAFTLTVKGAAALAEEPAAHRPEPRNFVSEALIKHELKVSAVGLVLTQIHGLSSRPEHPQVVWTQVGGRRQLTLEGAADIWIDLPQPRAVEVELTQKSRKSYEEIFERYRRRLKGGEAVLYLTGWPEGVGMILRNAREQRAPFVYGCALNEFRRTAGRCLFLGAVEGRTISLAARPAAAEATEVAR